MVHKEVDEQPVSNVKSLRPETEIKSDREKELVNYFAAKLAAAREAGLTVDSMVFVILGEMERDDAGHPDGCALHYWIDESRHVTKELSFVEKLISNEISHRIDGMDES